MINEYEQRVKDMASRLPTLQAKFEDLRSASVQNQIDLRSDLASKVSFAVATLMKLAQLICGQPDRLSPHPEIEITIKELDSSWKESNKAAENLLGNINNNYINIADFNNVRLGRWYNQAVNLQAALRATQKSAKKDYRIEKSIQLSMFQARRDAESHALSLQQTLDEAQSEYDGLDQLALNPTMRRMTLQRFEHAMAICMFDLSDARNAVQTAIEQGSATEQRLHEQESTVREINNLVTMQADLISQGSSLLTDCSDLMGSVEHAEDEISCVRIHHFRAWQLVNRLSDRSESAEFALSKAACASCILMVIDTILEDHTLTARLTEMVQHLANYDDSEGCIQGIITGDYPNGLLAGVQRELELIQDRCLVSDIVSPAFERQDTKSPAFVPLKLFPTILPSPTRPMLADASMDLLEKESNRTLNIRRFSALSLKRIIIKPSFK